MPRLTAYVQKKRTLKFDALQGNKEIVNSYRPMGLPEALTFIPLLDNLLTVHKFYVTPGMAASLDTPCFRATRDPCDRNPRFPSERGSNHGQ
jgi:hypothetical protein